MQNLNQVGDCFVAELCSRHGGQAQRIYANSLKSTGTTLETPASIMVTPYIIFVLAMVRLLRVMRLKGSRCWV